MTHANANANSRIVRVHKGINTFAYYYEHDRTHTKVITDAHVLERIRALHIPPAYTDVVIWPREDDKIQAFGYDAKGRKQTIYAKWFVEQQSAVKFDRVMRLSRTIPRIQADVNRTLKEAVESIDVQNGKQVPMSNAIQVCMVVKLMMLCNFRIGNSANATKYKSYGLTTLQWRHVHVAKKTSECAQHVAFSFVGKKGVVNEAVCSDKAVNKILHYMKNSNGDGPNRNPKDPVFSISSSHVNDYLKGFSPKGGDQDISSKDLRTWQANALFMKYFNKNKDATMSLKKRQTHALRRVAEALHNTPAVCKRSYIYPEFLMQTNS